MITGENIPGELFQCDTIERLFVCWYQALRNVNETGRCYYREIVCQNDGYGHQNTNPKLLVLCQFFLFGTTLKFWMGKCLPTSGKAMGTNVFIQGATHVIGFLVDT